MTILHATESDFEQKVSEGVVLVDFWAPWCGPCKMISPVLDELSVELADKLSIVKVNVDDEPSIPAKYGVMGIPALFIFKDGKVVEQAAGFRPKEALLSIINPHL